MDIKTFLRQYAPALRYAQKCFDELDDARGTSLKSPRLDGMPRGGGGNGLDDQIARIDALERRAATARDKALEMAEIIEQIIESVQDNDEKAVLRLRYLRGYTWEEVGVELGWSVTSAWRIHGRAIQKLRKWGMKWDALSKGS